MKGSAAGVIGMLLADAQVAEAGKDRLTVPSGEGFNFFLDRFDDGRTKPYRVTFYNSGFKSIYKLSQAGFVTDIKADEETYTITYTENGDLETVTGSSTRRNLDENNEESIADMPTNIMNSHSRIDDETRTLTYADNRDDVETNGSKLNRKVSNGHQERSEGIPIYPWNAPRTANRRLYACEDCELTWETMCDQGVETVCNLQGYGSPVLSAGETSIDAFCNTLGGICDYTSALDVCEGECDVDCLPPMTVTLEWTGASGLSGGEVPSLSLYVMEPGGMTARPSNSDTGTGTLTASAFKHTYTMLSGLDQGTTGSTFIAFAEWWEGFAPVSWTLTAIDGTGRTLRTTEGQFSGDCEATITSSSTISNSDQGTSRGTTNLMYIELFEYVDNGCV